MFFELSDRANHWKTEMPDGYQSKGLLCFLQLLLCIHRPTLSSVNHQTNDRVSSSKMSQKRIHNIYPNSSYSLANEAHLMWFVPGHSDGSWNAVRRFRRTRAHKMVSRKRERATNQPTEGFVTDLV